MPQMSQTYNAINKASTSVATSWVLTSTGVFVNTQTITIGGGVFTTVNALSVGPAVPGEVVIGANAAATLTNLAAAINAPSTSSATFTALSDANAYLIKSLLKLTAVATATTLTITSSANPLPAIVVSETETNAAWTVSYVSGSIPMYPNAKTSVQFIASGVSAGHGVFTIDVSNDDSNWIAYNKMTTNVTNTNAQTDTRVASVTLSSNTSAMVSLPEAFAFFRVRVVPTTDGAYSAVAYVS